MDGVFCRVANSTVVFMEFPAATRHHQGRYVGMLTGQKEQQFCDLNVTGPACTSSCTIRQSPPTVTCGFQHLEDMQVDMSFVVKSSSGDVLADCPCELYNCRCFSKRRGSSWNAPVTVHILNNSWTAEFVMDTIMNRTDYVCDLFSNNVPSKTPCHFEDGERHGQSLAIATAVLSSLFLLIFLSLLLKALCDAWESFGEIPNTGRECLQAKVSRVAKCFKQKLEKLSDAAFLLVVIFQILICILAIASAVG
ncbi:hypothetical protein V1264_017282 [Littorina saxatilis]|uniref:Uncharacterized protein n=2 Tax=Littorina saxatilis TaxID=31220 RepID=A0AAN9BIC5_9CAEN